MATFIKAGFWEQLCKPCRGYKGWLNLDQLITSLLPAPAYKVYTALLTQSGGDDPQNLSSGDAVTEGVTYGINSRIPTENTWDFSNVGGPVYPDNYSFVATSSEVPNNYGDALLNYNTGAPVVTVLENTIGNIWFTYDSVGQYFANSSGLFTINKTFFVSGFTSQTFLLSTNIDDNQIGLGAFDVLSFAYDNNVLYNTPIEIRIYN